MKKSAVLNTYKIAAMALAMTFAVACTRPGQSPTLNAQGKTTAPTAQQQHTEGTTDGAGGNGTNGKIYESYIVDPQSLPAYKNILEAKIKAMDKLQMDAYRLNGIQDPESIYSLSWNLKKWYLAPVSLKTLDKKTLGIEFTNEKTEQLALQTESEIWIDSRLFEKMSLEEQANLLAHEYVMSLYLFKFQNLNDICMSARSVSAHPENYDCKNNLSSEDSIIVSGESKRPLDKSDYARIRSLTSTIVSKEFSSQKHLVDTFLGLGFDKRIFIVNQDPKSKEKISFSNEELIASLKRAVYSQKLDGKCQGIQSGATSTCKVEIQDTRQSNGLPGLKVILKDAATSQVIRSVVITDNNSAGSYDFEIPNLEFEITEFEVLPKNEGGLFGSVKVLLTKEDKDMPAEVTGLVFTTNVVTSSKEVNQNGNKCLEIQAVPLKAKSQDQEAVLVSTSHSIQDYIVRGLTSLNHTTNCTPGTKN